MCCRTDRIRRETEVECLDRLIYTETIGCASKWHVVFVVFILVASGMFIFVYAAVINEPTYYLLGAFVFGNVQIKIFADHSLWGCFLLPCMAWWSTICAWKIVWIFERNSTFEKSESQYNQVFIDASSVNRNWNILLKKFLRFMEVLIYLTP